MDVLTPEIVEAAEDKLRTEEAKPRAIQRRRRGSAGAWARRFTGVAKLAPGETTDDSRMGHYREKFGA